LRGVFAGSALPIVELVLRWKMIERKNETPSSNINRLYNKK